MSDLGLILLATGLISLGSLVGILTVAVNQKKLDRFLLLLVSLSAGAMMGGAFLHLLPEAVKECGCEMPFVNILIAFGLFFVIEKILRWRHCHKHGCTEHLGQMNLIGDSVHNFIDGLIMAATFGVDVKLGWVTTLAMALHEIPQEIGDFGVLLYAGWERRKALIYNFLAATTVVLGGLVGYWLSGVERLIENLLPLAAGGFIYIGASDLIPEIKKEEGLKKSLVNFGMFSLGILLMWWLRMVD
jgi:zinc and cadmium transporter